MPAITWFLKPDVTVTGGVNQGLSETSPGAEATTSPASGWTVAKLAPTVYGQITPGVKQVSGAFGASVLPSATWDSSAALISDTAYTGSFATGTWAATMKVIAVTSGGDQDGALTFRLFRVSGLIGAETAVQITSAVTVGGTVTNLTTAAAQNSNGTTASISSFSVTNEYIAMVLAWEITGAGGATTRDVVFRKGTGITLVSPVFTAAASTKAPPFQGRTVRNSLLRR